MEETSRRGILGRHQSCVSERIDILSNSIEWNHLSRNTSTLLYSKSWYEKHTCHLDLHQRSHYVTIGQRNWVRKLLDNQKGKLLDNQKEKLLDKQNSSNQRNEFQIQFVIDQGDLISRMT